MIWQLTFYKSPEAARADCFQVGFFDSLDEVESVKAHYTSNVPGFRDCPDGTWELTGHPIDRPPDGLLWQVIGYNWSEDGDERDLICSPVFADRAAAERCRTELAARYERESMEIVRIEVDRRWWAEGFDSIG
ncbi:MAG: hypothetical protein IJ343_08430 [Clostridia bacterium]|nr:hypothetical protein [Clostridia bacterium]